MHPLIFSVLCASLVSACVAQPGKTVAAPQTQSENPWYRAAQDRLQTEQERARDNAPARNVILFVGDGMSLATVTAARIYGGQKLGLAGEEHQLSFEKLPYVALARTWTTNQQVSDSAGTATALLSGVKTLSGVVGLADGVRRADCSSVQGQRIASLAELAEDAGLATGVVTTARVTHATPAAAYAHTPERDWEASAPAGCEDVATQLLRSRHGDGPEVVLGGGRRSFLPMGQADPEEADTFGERMDGQDLTRAWLKRFPANGAYVWHQAGFDALDPRRDRHVLGLFSASHMAFEADRHRDSAGEPSLAAMTATAIRLLEHQGKGYFLLVEGGRIDHAHHSGNAYRALEDTVAFAAAVQTARDLSNPDETLIVVTADHGHVFDIGGYPTRGNPILGKVVENGDHGEPEEDFARDWNGMPFTTLVYGNGPGHLSATSAQPAGPKVFPHEPEHGTGGAVARVDLAAVDTTAPDYLQETTVPLKWETHSGTDVAIYAGGPGAHLFRGVHEQHYVFHVLRHALRLEQHGGQPVQP